MANWLEIHHLILIIVALVAALILVGGGKGLGKLVGPVMKKLIGKEAEVTVNIGGDMAGASKKDQPCGFMINPKYCPAHEAEHERSIRNEETNEKQWQAIKELGKEINAGIAQLQKDQAEGIASLHKNQLRLFLGLVQSGVLDAKYIPNDIGGMKPSKG